MSDEATLNVSLNIRSSDGLLNYRSPITQYRADITGRKGPTPGALAVSTTGVSVSFAQLTRPGLCRIANLGRVDLVDDDSYVEYGLYDTGTTKFYPLGELLAGEFGVIPGRLSRNLGEKEDVPGTGTTTITTVTLYLRAFRATQNVVVEAFEV